MLVFFHNVDPYLPFLKISLITYFNKKRISVSFQEVSNETITKLNNLSGYGNVLLFYSMSHSICDERMDFCNPSPNTKIQKIALCQTYQDGIDAIDQESDYALLLPLTAEKIFRCCNYLCSCLISQRKGMSMTNINSPLSVKDEYELLMDTLRISVSKHILDDNCSILWANNYYYQMTGYSKEEHTALYHNNCREYFERSPEDFKRLKENVKRAFLAGEHNHEQILHFPQKNGDCIWIQVKIAFTKELYNGYPVIYTVYTDIEERVQDELERSITYDKLPGFTAKLHVHVDETFTLLESNRSNIDACIHTLFHSFLEDVKENQSAQENIYLQMQKHVPLHFESSVTASDGKASWFRVSGEYITTLQNDPVYLFVCLDISQEKQQLEQINQLSFVDPVTNGYNQRRFTLEMSHIISASPAGSYALVSIDIRKFKLVNELFGIQEGDRTLKYVYHQFSSLLEPSELVCRPASDNFLLLLKQAGEQVITKRISKMVQHINAFNETLDRKYYFAFHAGIYVIPTSSQPLEVLVDRANIAKKRASLYTSDGLLNLSFYTEKDSQTLMSEKEIEDHMESALVNHEFEVYLQPKMSLKNNSIEGAEALVRWNTPHKGLLPPGDFIPIFERNGFITKMDLYVFEEVCKMIRKWIDMDIQPIIVSVNLSRVHLAISDFLDHYELIRQKYQIPVTYLEFELTETILLEHPERLKNIIAQMRTLGYQCSMDDFGSGYSSLNLLKDMDFDVMKLDRAFFKASAQITDREKDIISTVIDLAGKLHMTSVAEGVETKQQLDFLKHTGCDLIQGFVFSKPLPMQEFEILKYGHAL